MNMNKYSVRFKTVRCFNNNRSNSVEKGVLYEVGLSQYDDSHYAVFNPKYEGSNGYIGSYPCDMFEELNCSKKISEFTSDELLEELKTRLEK